MILFDLSCKCGCQFEAWFQGHADYHAQLENGLLSCPECGSSAIRKILSPVAAVRSGCMQKRHDERSSLREKDFEKQAMQVLRQLSDFVEKNFEDVGTRLADEALKMHYGVTENRSIRGVATPDQEKVLKEEGIELLTVPLFKKSEAQ